MSTSIPKSAPAKASDDPHCPAPVSAKLEEAFYPKASTVARAALTLLGQDPERVGDLTREDHFKGPY